MDHSHLEKIYNEIKEEPYLVSFEFGVEAPNCYFKGVRLIKAAAELGYEVRGRVADVDWNDTPAPKEIINLRPQGGAEKHFYVEVKIDEQWRTLDPSMDQQSEKLGFRAVSFEGDDRTCFDLHKVYSQEEQIKEFQSISDESQKEYFKNMKPFLSAFNEWIEAERAKL